MKTYEEIIKENPTVEQTFHWGDYDLYRKTIAAIWSMGYVAGFKEALNRDMTVLDQVEARKREQELRVADVMKRNQEATRKRKA